MAAQPEPGANREVPVLCARCGEVFPAAEAQAGAEPSPKLSIEPNAVPTCPHCGRRGNPAGVMRGLTFPSVETFVRSVARSFEADEE